jgi:hypothetical protein
MSFLKNANLGLSFLLELCAMAAFAYWGYQAGAGLFVKIALALAAALLAAVVWGLLAAPRAPRRLPKWPLLVFKLLFFGLAAAALFAAEQSTLAGVLAGLAVINLGLGYTWGQR